jgi:thiamine-phosphate pyrophosphorylase
MSRLRGLYAIADTATLADGMEARAIRQGGRACGFATQALLPAVEQALRGGARLIQYRDKSKEGERRRRDGQALAALCRRFSVPFLVNDDVDLAAVVEADGVHLGRDDPAIEGARARLGKSALIGVSCYNELTRALDAERRGADYVAFGSFFPSPTKPGAVRASLELLKQAHAKLRVPIVAIGGITPENGASLIAAGADLLAVIDGVFNQTDIRAAAARYAQLFTTPSP